MVVTATQGVRRSLLIPALDGMIEKAERGDPNPTPMLQWLFTPPPYISSMNVERQTLEVCNPSAVYPAQLGGFSIHDHGRRAAYTFPSDCILAPRTRLTLYCCPGQLSGAELRALPEPKLYWITTEGTLRRKDVLGEDERIVLCDTRGAEVAALQVSEDGRTRLEAPGARQVQLVALRKLTVALCYVRIVCIGCAAVHAQSRPARFVFWTGLAHAADLFSRWAVRQQDTPMDALALCLATLGDRLATLCMLGALVLSFGTAYGGLFVAMLFADLASYWLQMSCHALTVGRLRPPTQREVEAELVGFMVARHPAAITAITIGNELFLLFLYILSPAIHPVIFGARQLWPAEDRDFASAALQGGVVAAAPTMPWVRPLLLPLMLACVIRQLANVVQVLISLSRLSSGVLLEATRRDVLRARPAVAATEPRRNGYSFSHLLESLSATGQELFPLNHSSEAPIGREETGLPPESSSTARLVATTAASKQHWYDRSAHRKRTACSNRKQRL